MCIIYMKYIHTCAYVHTHTYTHEFTKLTHKKQGNTLCS